MKELLATIMLSFLLFNSAYSQQDSSKRYIKIVIDLAISQEQEQQINTELNQFPGIETARMDKTTGVFLGIYNPTENLLDQTFLHWFENHGYIVKCYYDDVYTQGNMLELTKKNCR